MRNFLRSVRYVLPYKLRLLAIVFCVVMIAALWAAGLSVLLPAMKVLISEEGLHGWSDQILVDQRLDVKTNRLDLRDKDLRDQAGGAAQVLTITEIPSASPMAGQGVTSLEWVVGLDGKYLGAEDLLMQLAADEGAGPWNLLVLHPVKGTERTVVVSPEPAERTGRAIHWAVGLIGRPENQEQRFTVLLSIILFAVALNYLRDIFRFFQTYLVRTTVYRAIMDIRCENYGVAIRLPLSHFSVHGTADTMSRFIADCDLIARGLVTLLGKTLVEPAKLIGVLIMAVALNWKLTLLACVVGPPTFILIRKLGKLIRKASKRALESQALLLRSLEETLTGLRIVKAYTNEQAEEARFRGITRKLYKQQKRVSAADAATGPLVEALGITAAMAAVVLAAYWVFHSGTKHTGAASWLLDNPMDREKFMAVIAMLAAMFDPVRRLSQVTVRFYNAEAAAQRVFELRDEATEADLTDAKDLPRHSDQIEFRDVTYVYPNATRPSLTDVTLKVWQGESVAFVGANGSGKTTLLSMLPRFFEPVSGKILIDGVDIAEATLRSVRGQIGLVSQESVIFHASVADNIAYGCPKATRADIENASRQAFADEFISQLPDGYDTVIGERGSTLSGGQRQRIAIARAILRDPAILILDEAMSQIDSESEAKINQALESFMAGRTTLLIAHRFSTVISADTVVVLDDGRVIDIGKHDELVTRCEIYRTLFETQLIGDQ